MAIATRRARGAGDANGLRTSIERRRIVNAKFTARRQRMWEDARLQREEEEKRAAMEILERRKRERARLSSYIYATIQSHPKCLTKSRSEGSLSYSAESSQKSAGFKQKGYFSGGSVRNSRLGSAASKFDQIGVQEKESEQTQIGTSSTFPVIKQKSGKMRGSAGVSSMWSRSTTEAGRDFDVQCTDVLEDASSSMKGASSHDMMWKSNAEAVLCQTIENMNDNTMLWNVEAFSPIAVKNAKAHMPLGKNNDMLNYATMIGNREGQIYSFSSKDCKDTNLDGGLCFPNEHNEIFSMDAGMIIKSPSRSTLSSRKKCSTSFLSSESSQSKKSVQLPPLKHISNLSYRKDKKLILQSLRNRQKKNLLNISEKERSLLASIERLDVKLATTSLKGDTKSISMISDENSVKSAPTVMEQLNSCQGNRPRKILRHPLRPLSSLSAALPMKRRQNVGLTNKSKDNTNCCNHSNESKESEDSFPDSPLEVVQPTVGTIHIHQDPRFLLSP